MTNQTKFNLPQVYSTLEETLESAEKVLVAAVDDAKTLFHTPVVSSFKDNQITSRVMVLREFSLRDRKMRFHTDHRAAKINHFDKISTASVIGYDPELKIQIKLQGNISTHYNDEITKSAWDQSASRSKKCYSVKGCLLYTSPSPRDRG